MGILLYEKLREFRSFGSMGYMKGITILLRDRLSESKLGAMPFTLVLSLRSICLRLVFLQLSKIMQSDWMSILLSYSVWRVLLFWMRVIKCLYLVSWLRFLTSGDERQSFSMAESCNLTNSSSNVSFPNLQLQRVSSLNVAILTRLLGLSKFLLSFMMVNAGFS